MQIRELALQEWIKIVLNINDFEMTPLAGDASFRKYWRIRTLKGTYVVMDAPPEKESLHSFIQVSDILHQSGVLVPEILATNLEDGFLLLKDFGDDIFFNSINNSDQEKYYEQAIQSLLKIQKYPTVGAKLPYFDKPFMLQEMQLFIDWFLIAYLNIELLSEEMEIIQNTMIWLANQISLQPQVLIHRDFHSRNLMVIKKTPITIGVIDFQDAMIGPVTYDLVSILKDCYVELPKNKIALWANYFYEQISWSTTLSPNELIKAFDLCGLQRHLKVLGIFCRLYLRDEKPSYLQNLPLVLKYTLECCLKYENLHPLANIIKKRVQLP